LCPLKSSVTRIPPSLFFPDAVMSRLCYGYT